MTKIHNISYQYYSWQELGDDIFQLAKKIIQSEQKFDRVIALAKGGLTFSRSLVDYLGIDEISSLHIEFYTGIHNTQEMPVITQSLPVSIRNEKILLFDDLSDSGKTLQTAVEYLKHHGVSSIHTAVFFVKPHSSFKPDFVIRELNEWIIFPNEVRETVLELQASWLKNGDDLLSIKNQLIQIGLPKDQVDFYLQTHTITST